RLDGTRLPQLGGAQRRRVDLLQQTLDPPTPFRRRAGPQRLPQRRLREFAEFPSSAVAFSRTSKASSSTSASSRATRRGSAGGAGSSRSRKNGTDGFGDATRAASAW